MCQRERRSAARGAGGRGGRAWRERGSERGRGWDHFWEGLRGDLPLARVLPGARREIFPGECTLTARVVRRRVLAAEERSIPPAQVRPPPPLPRTNWTRLVLPPPVLSGHVSSFPPSGLRHRARADRRLGSPGFRDPSCAFSKPCVGGGPGALISTFCL